MVMSPRCSWILRCRNFGSLIFTMCWYILKQKCLKKWIGSALHGTQHLTPNTNHEHHNTFCHSQTDGQTDNSIMPYCVQQYDLLKLQLFTCCEHKQLKFRIQIAWTDSIGCSKRTVAMPRNLFVSLSIFSSTCNTLPAIRNTSSSFSAVTM